MNTQEVADKLVQLCREGKNEEAIDQLYADNVVSKEPKGSHMELIAGKEGVKNKTIQWENSVQEIHSASISEPLVADGFFSVVMDMDVTYKEHGRMAMSEVAVYQVADGKIVADQYFYSIPGQ